MPGFGGCKDGVRRELAVYDHATSDAVVKPHPRDDIILGRSQAFDVGPVAPVQHVGRRICFRQHSPSFPPDWIQA